MQKAPPSDTQARDDAPHLYAACSQCGKVSIDLAAAARALAIGDVDAALQAGLLDWCGQDACPAALQLLVDADTAQLKILQHSRDERLTALAARARFAKRNARIALREQQRAARRAAPAQAALPSAAAAALARAKARAAGKMP